MKNTQTKINLFSTPVVIENDIYRLDDTEMNFLKSLPLRKLDFNSISQSILILDNTEMSKISMIIDYYVDNYVSNVLEISNQVVRTQSWISINKKGERHHTHEHPNTFVSAVFYADCKSGDLCFKRIRSVIQEGYLFSYKIKHYNQHNSKVWEIKPRTGDLVIFPGWITHSCTENENDTDRIALGVNYFLKGEIGSEDTVDLINL